MINERWYQMVRRGLLCDVAITMCRSLLMPTHWAIPTETKPTADAASPRPAFRDLTDDELQRALRLVTGAENVRSGHVLTGAEREEFWSIVTKAIG